MFKDSLNLEPQKYLFNYLKRNGFNGCDNICVKNRSVDAVTVK